MPESRQRTNVGRSSVSRIQVEPICDGSIARIERLADDATGIIHGVGEPEPEKYSSVSLTVPLCKHVKAVPHCEMAPARSEFHDIDDKRNNMNNVPISSLFRRLGTRELLPPATTYCISR